MTELTIPTKSCTKCKLVKPADKDHFHVNNRSADGFSYSCKRCSKDHRDGKTVNREEKKKYVKRWRNRLRSQILRHYSGGDPKCRCCGECNDVFLALDHINGGGTKHRNGIGDSSSALYSWVRKMNFPLGFQVLCHNCNWAKHVIGSCPHRSN